MLYTHVRISIKDKQTLKQAAEKQQMSMLQYLSSLIAKDAQTSAVKAK